MHSQPALSAGLQGREVCLGTDGEAVQVRSKKALVEQARPRERVTVWADGGGPSGPAGARVLGLSLASAWQFRCKLGKVASICSSVRRAIKLSISCGHRGHA